MGRYTTAKPATTSVRVKVSKYGQTVRGTKANGGKIWHGVRENFPTKMAVPTKVNGSTTTPRDMENLSTVKARSTKVCGSATNRTGKANRPGKMAAVMRGSTHED
jgi:hypothetical protein